MYTKRGIKVKQRNRQLWRYPIKSLCFFFNNFPNHHHAALPPPPPSPHLSRETISSSSAWRQEKRKRNTTASRSDAKAAHERTRAWKFAAIEIDDLGTVGVCMRPTCLFCLSGHYARSVSRVHNSVSFRFGSFPRDAWQFSPSPVEKERV